MAPISAHAAKAWQVNATLCGKRPCLSGLVSHTALRMEADADIPPYRIWLQHEFSERCRRNPRFSIRSFSRLLKMDPSTVYQVLAGTRKISPKIIARLCDELSVRPEDRAALMGLEPAKNREPDNYHQVAADIFATIADWYHFAILELTFVSDFQSEPEWIAKRLRIGVTEARLAVSRLLRLQVLKYSNGRLVKSQIHPTNDSGSFVPAQKEFQRQVLKLALAAIDDTPAEKKDITSMTMAIDPEQLDEARKRIQRFRRDLCAFLENGPRTEVYNLGIQLYPLSQTDERGKS